MIQEKPTLKIAHHLLEGKLVKLQRPLVVLLRNDSVDPVLRYGRNSETEACFLKAASSYRWCTYCRNILQ